MNEFDAAAAEKSAHQLLEERVAAIEEKLGIGADDGDETETDETKE